MQLLYGNDGVNYHTIAKSQDMTEIQEKELLAGYLGYEFVKDASAYSSVEREPIALTYVTTNLSKTLQEEKILFSVNGRMTNYITPSYWAHFQLGDVSQDVYGDKFFDLLRYSYIRDIDVNGYMHKDIDTFKGEVKERQIIDDNALDKERVVVLVAAILNVADSLSRQVKVILDVEGDLYNQRALEVISTVYKYIPFNIRKIAGFCTYSKTDGTDSNRIKLCLYTREQLNLLKNDVIDLQNIDIQKELSLIPKEIVEFAKELVEKDDATRQEWFQSFQSVFGVQTVSVEEHRMMYQNVRKWQNHDLESMQDEMALYAYKELSQNQQTLVYKIFCNIMNKRFREENYAPKYSEIIGKLLEKQNDFQFGNQLTAYLALGESIKGISFDEQMFLDWENVKIIEPLKKKYTEEVLISKYKEKFIQLHKMRCYGDKLAKICLQMEKLIKAAVEEEYAEIEQRTKEEEEHIKVFLKSHNSFLGCIDELRNMYSVIKYKSNYDVFASGLQENVNDCLKQIPYLLSYKDYTDYKKYIEEIRLFFSKKIADELQDLVEQKGKVVKEMQQCKQIEWNHRNQILESYQNIYMMHNLAKGKEVEVPNYALRIGHKSFQLNEEKLLRLMQFILGASDSRWNNAKNILLSEAELLERLMDIEAFGAEHFNYLIRGCSDEIMQEKVINYYVSGTRLLSKDQVEEGLTGIDVLEMANFLPANEKLNILGISVKEKLKNSVRDNSSLKKENKSTNGSTLSKRMRKRGRWIIFLALVIFLVLIGLAVAGIFFLPK